MADVTAHDPATGDLLAIFERARTRLFGRLDGLTDAEYHWEPVARGGGGPPPRAGGVAHPPRG
ncbi:hypothetical protein AB8B12_33840, partial [Streptomyces sp. PGLac3x]